MNFPAIEEVKHLHHYKSIEDECEMSRIHIVFLKIVKIGIVSVYFIKSPINNCPRISYPVIVLRSEILSDYIVKLIGELWNELLSVKKNKHDDKKLIDSLSNYVLSHSGRNQTLLS